MMTSVGRTSADIGFVQQAATLSYNIGDMFAIHNDQSSIEAADYA